MKAISPLNLALNISSLFLSKKKVSVVSFLLDKKYQILSIGTNSYNKTHPTQALFAKRVGDEERVFLHAEIDALIKCKELHKVRYILVARVGRDGKIRNAKPCPICSAAITHYCPDAIIIHT